jgi:hypothetical protein
MAVVSLFRVHMLYMYDWPVFAGHATQQTKENPFAEVTKAIH